ISTRFLVPYCSWSTTNRKAPPPMESGAFSVQGRGKRKGAIPFGARPASAGKPILLDLGFLELDVLPGDRIVLRLGHLVGHRAAVLRRHIEETGVSRRQQLDLDGRSFRHGGSAFEKNEAVDGRMVSTPKSGAKLQIAPEKSSPFRLKKQADQGKQDVKPEESRQSPGETVIAGKIDCGSDRLRTGNGA